MQGIQNRECVFVNFVQTFPGSYAIIIRVNPQYIYSFATPPNRRIPSPEKAAVGCLFAFLEIISGLVRNKCKKCDESLNKLFIVNILCLEVGIKVR